MGEEDGALSALLQCPICLCVFDDPWLAADGFCYCLRCLDEWINVSDGDWISPRTNVRMPAAGAFLARDFQRAALACEAKTRAIQRCAPSRPLAHPVDEVVIRLATTRDRGRLVAPPVLRRDVLLALVEAAVRADGFPRLEELARRPLFCYSTLELAFHAEALGQLRALGGMLALLAAWDRSLPRAPLVCAGVWLSLLEGMGRTPSAARLADHCIWRLLRRDAVWMTPEAMRPRGIPDHYTGEFPRALSPESSAWTATFGNRAVRLEAAQGPHQAKEFSTSVLRVCAGAGGQERLFFMESQSRRQTPGSREETFWEARRRCLFAVRTPRPTPYDRPPPPPADPAPLPPPPPPRPSQAPEFRGDIPKDFTVFERELRFLPHSIAYASRCPPPRQLLERLQKFRRSCLERTCAGGMAVID